jgi:hypothetical protein
MGYPPMGMPFMMQVNHPTAVPAMVLGIISLAVTCIGIFTVYCCGIFAFPGLVCGIIAVILGFKAKKAIDAEPHKFKGRGMALAGLIMGFIGAGLALLSEILYIFVIYYYMSFFSMGV